MDCSPPGSSVHRILQARTLEWVASSSSQGSARARAPDLPEASACPPSLLRAPGCGPSYSNSLAKTGLNGASYHLEYSPERGKAEGRENFYGTGSQLAPDRGGLHSEDPRRPGLGEPGRGLDSYFTPSFRSTPEVPYASLTEIGKQLGKRRA